MLHFACQTVHEGRIYQLKFFCGLDYPDKPPLVRFETQINMSVVNYETGVVGVASLYLFHIICAAKLQDELT